MDHSAMSIRSNGASSFLESITRYKAKRVQETISSANMIKDPDSIISILLGSTSSNSSMIKGSDKEGASMSCETLNLLIEIIKDVEGFEGERAFEMKYFFRTGDVKLPDCLMGRICKKVKDDLYYGVYPNIEQYQMFAAIANNREQDRLNQISDGKTEMAKTTSGNTLLDALSATSTPIRFNQKLLKGKDSSDLVGLLLSDTLIEY